MDDFSDEWRRKRMSDLADHVGGKAALGRLLGYKDGAFVRQMIAGERPITEKTIRSVHEKPGLAGWFVLQDAGSVIPSHEDDSSQGVKIQQFDTGGSMGHGVLLRDQPGVIKSWTVSDAWLQQNVHRVTSPKNLCIVTGFGPSMQPLFNPGDPLLVDRGITRIDVDAVYFFRIGEEGFIKQVQRLYVGEALTLRAKSYNSMYDPFDIPQTGDFEVFGRVVKIWKGEEF
ncbi:helix-turn-helix transcriptional regulator [Hydrogenophaga aromaticivorans]|uniref:S24 family peptidase n=1 Tax=Hydrogenophaga aromaticivorans TaxID=2610898 RepID=UPI001B36CA67|nr:helix-turn-helix transcriptional regulator [Hydrogenophaga aromaticivorans]MBQ0917484.1 helix-turn-helix transcriptional regulator [Hydrogenophaga aromaticivorans]